MKYVSTRGHAPELSFKDALLVGLASDGGLYVPSQWPVFTQEEIAQLRGKPYVDVALQIFEPFVGGEIDSDALRSMITDAYSTFRHPAVTPLVQTGPNDWLLELFHGPTLAFKDVAMQVLARLMDYVLEERGEQLTIVGATSGDTGGAAMSAFQACKEIQTFFMFPDGRVSDFQRRQMTTLGAENCHAIAIDGNFDDCQSMVKAMFADDQFCETVQLSAVNSINWGRVMAQVVYYFTSALALGAPASKVSFTVPTGNFGDIYAGFVAKKMGLPIDQLVIATNENDILERTLRTGQHSLKKVVATITPSMDIQISSNFERLLFEASDREPAIVRGLMDSLKQSSSYDLPASVAEAISEDFEAGRATQTETLAEILRLYTDAGYISDPHTAVATFVAKQNANSDVPMVTLSTAHPAKFPDAVQSAIGLVPAPPAGREIAEDAREELIRMENDIGAVKAAILTKLNVVSTRDG
ncbi:threonine synthase [uncultured Roseovarius sp.]|uniref:threonine synthase n=1 Tax=uncultured Roseovarius sp. TaxID=293344 RepID=UPI00260DE226|nr:threonine synthase [uncultured Roseovarius sp.]